MDETIGEEAVCLKDVVFEVEDFFQQEKILEKMDRLIGFWGRELVHKKYLECVPDSDEAWLRFLDMEIYWGDLKDPWDHYVVGSLIFFVNLRADIRRDFLLQPDYIRGQRLGRWLGKLGHYITPLLRDVVTKFCLTYSMILERKAIKVRYNDIK